MVLRATLTAHFDQPLKSDESPCPVVDPDEVDVPDDVLALWDTHGAPPFPVRAIEQKSIPLTPSDPCS
jgi:hypothetical protein